MNHQATDKDSLAALDALLRIRESGGRGAQVFAPATPQANQMKTLQPISASSLAGLSNLLAFGPGMILPRTNQYTSVHPTSANGLQTQLQALANTAQVPQTASSFSASATPTASKAAASSSLTASTVEENIRREKVEEALRSKPQRGRKRDDLSDKERLELTRTRNREHAKSTRIRKKARYQELLDCEEKMKDVKSAEIVKAKRHENIEKFLSIRQKMLQEALEQSIINPPPASAASLKSPSLGLSGALEGQAESQQKQNLDVSNQMEGVVHDVSNFHFSTAEIPDTDDNTSSITRMKEWDKLVCSQLANVASAVVKYPLCYAIQGGRRAIALSDDGCGYARVELVLNDEQVSKPVLSGLFMFRFAAGSHYLLCAEWTTFGLDSKVLIAAAGRQVASNPLQNHFVHPSVVSLDVDKHAEMDDNGGPGMHL